MRNRKLKETISTLTKGVFQSLGDFLLFYFSMMENQIGKSKTSRGVWQAFYETDEVFKTYKSNSFKVGFYVAQRKNLIRIDKKDDKLTIKITEVGKTRLNSLLPKHDKDRVWDKKLYLVTYDICEKRKKDRELLRNMIKQLGMGMLQDSVWITPYNPKATLRNFIKDRKLSGSVIISCVGEDGAIGEDDVKTLICKVYKLEQLNKRYEEFIDNANQGYLKPWTSLKYLSILRDDPQLPFDLLPVWWKGEEANKIYQEFLTNKL